MSGQLFCKVLHVNSVCRQERQSHHVAPVRSTIRRVAWLSIVVLIALVHVCSFLVESQAAHQRSCMSRIKPVQHSIVASDQMACTSGSCVSHSNWKSHHAQTLKYRGWLRARKWNESVKSICTVATTSSQHASKHCARMTLCVRTWLVNKRSGNNQEP